MSFSWSFSKYKAYDTCPKRHYEVDIAKNYTDVTEQLKWGNEVHSALARACTGKEPLPGTMKDYQKWVDEAINEDATGEVLVEKKYALTRDFQPTSWFGPDAWYRGVVDFARVKGSVGFARDWKTGKMQHDSRQLMMMAQCLFSNFKDLKRVLTEFVWFKDDCTTPETFDRDKIAREWIPVLAQVEEMEEAAKTMNYPPKPGKLCYKYCPVISCPFHGKRF